MPTMRSTKSGNNSSVSMACLEPLTQAAQSRDQAKFEAAYNSAIQGCNSCHGAQTYGAINKPFSLIKVQVPKNSPEDVYAYIP